MSRDAVNSASDWTAEVALTICDGVLARLWLIGPGDLCASCPMRPECPDQTSCLHLAASAGTTRRVDGPFRRFPIGARRVGQVAISRAAYIASAPLAAAEVADAVWLATHQVQGFAALPLVHGDACLGVLAVFSRRRISPEDERALNGIASLGALAIARTEVAQLGAPDRSRGDASESPSALATLAEVERRAIERALERTGGRVSGPRGAALILGLKPTTLHSRMLKLGIRRR